ncbi:protein SMAX1-LIKE 7-like [Primulina huaijiensis]|uniref:protein SMAX1-LIKE 7-like n=1 Tax=Primulina huaijiensis TaxID=1492673 RepID=UPI003CC6F0B0
MVALSYQFLDNKNFPSALRASIYYQILSAARTLLPMPTPVNAARQCLTQEAAAALDESVTVARRRGHAQTTSMHMVSSLLSLPNSSLREACMRTRNNAYSTRVQFKALELSLSVALDRLPSSQAGKIEQPPVSNSLMAAIKRSQANQRRQPENFSYYQQQQQQYSSCSSVPIVKVELQNLILSILDDPLVSRVFGEAGFRSYDIKAATLRPGNSFHTPHLFGYSSRYKRPNPPLFLCNFGSGDNISEVGGKSFNFPFMGCFSRDENSRRIGEVMVKNKKRNPLLLGVSSGDALKSFLEVVRRKIDGVLPVGLSGLSVICVKDEILRFVNGDLDQGSLKLRLEEVERVVESVVGTGVVLNFGDLKLLCGDVVCIDGLNDLVSKLTGLLQIHGGKLWLIGAAATHEIYFKFLNKFPSVEDDWDLEILPITSLTFSMGGSYPRSSLMESFVPLGGFFSMPSDAKNTLSSSCHYVVRCHLCNEKCEQEVKALSDGGSCDSVLKQSQSSLPPWLQIAEYNTQNGVADLKAKDDRLSLNAKISGIQKKWDSICQHHHYSQSFAKGYTSQCSYPFPRVTGFQVMEEGKENASKDSSKHSDESSPEQGSKNVISSLSTDLWQSSSLKESNTLNVLSKTNNLNVLSKPVENHSKFDREMGGLKLSASSASIINGQKSPTSATSVTTDLGLGTVSACTDKEFEKHADQTHMDTLQRYKVNDPKVLFKFLVERVGQQEEAIYAVVEAITRRPTKMTGLHGASRGDTWFNFRGPDRLGKRKLGLALAEMLYGSTDSFIFTDLSFQDEKTHPDALWNLQVINKYDVSMRGTVVDYLVEKLSKRPSVVFLENVDKADLVVQNSLFHAVKTGRFIDLSGREVNISNSVFLVTTRFKKGSNCFFSGNEIAEYSEEEISLVKGRTIQIWIGFDLNDDPTSEKSTLSDPISVNKRKLTASSSSRGRNTDRIGILDMSKRAHKVVNRYLDLNLPADASETVSKEETESESSSENSKSWLEDFEGQIDRVVVFEPFDFEKLAEKLIKDMKESSNKIFGVECSLEIESSVMQQLLAAAYLFDIQKVEDWIQRVLKQGFAEAIGKYSIDVHSVVKLRTCDGGFSEDKLPGSLLPAGIILS